MAYQYYFSSSKEEGRKLKGVILAGGTGTRLCPLTKAVNKHLLPVGKYPMICHTVSKFKKAGIEELLIVTGKDHISSFVHLLGSGYDWGVSLTYKVQDQPGGIAQALALAEDFSNKQPITVILGDNIFSGDISPYIDDFTQASGAKVLLKEVTDPRRYGIAEIKDQKIVSIEEKPTTPKSNLAVTGIYMYDCDVFKIIKQLKPSSRGELEITDVNNAYMKKDRLTFEILNGWWIDAGTHESLQQANKLAKGWDLGLMN